MPDIDIDAHIIEGLEANDPTLKASDAEVTSSEADTTTPPVKPDGATTVEAAIGDGDKSVAGKVTGADAGTQPVEAGKPASPVTATPQKDGSLKLSDGGVVKAGTERRLYEKAERFHEDNVKLVGVLKERDQLLQHLLQNVAPDYDRQIANLTGELNAFKAANTTANQLQLSPDEQTWGLKLTAAYKTNPLETLKYILAEAKAAGHSIEGMGPGVDTQAIMGLVRDAMQPFTTQQREQEAQQLVWDNAGTEANNFFFAHPDAKTHEEHLANLIAANPHLSPESVYYELRQSAQQMGLDWSKPLGPQVVAKKAAEAAKSGTLPANGGNGAGVTLPSGRPGATSSDTAAVPKQYRSDTPFGDIIKDAMRDAGMTIR